MGLANSREAAFSARWLAEAVCPVLPWGGRGDAIGGVLRRLPAPASQRRAIWECGRDPRLTESSICYWPVA